MPISNISDLGKITPTTPMIQEMRLDETIWELPTRMKNLFKQPIKKFQLWVTYKGSRQLLWEFSSLDKCEEIEGTLYIPKKYCCDYYSPPIYFLHYSVELEDGHQTTNNLHISSDKTTLSLNGGWIYCYSSINHSAEPWLGMVVEED